MIFVIAILSLIFIAIAFLLTEHNAKYLFSGYNTLSEEERLKFDIKSYLVYFKKFHLFLGISLFIIGLILQIVNPVWSGIFMTIYPILAYAYFIWQGSKFSGLSGRKQKIQTVIVISLMLGITVWVISMFFYSLQDNRIEINNHVIHIKGDYGMELKTNEIKSIELVQELPDMATKVNGFALHTIKKGDFKTKSGEHVKLFINTLEQPIICITTHRNQNIYYSSKDNSNQELFDLLKQEVNK